MIHVKLQASSESFLSKRMSLATFHIHYPSAFAEGAPWVSASWLVSHTCWPAVVWFTGVQGTLGHSQMAEASSDTVT